MKKIITILLVLIMFISFTGCSSKSDDSGDANVSASPKASEDSLQNDLDELSKIGEVEVKDGILTVSITLPSSFLGDVTQEDLDNEAGTSYVSAKLNDDGSVTMKLTKAQYEEMMREIIEEVDSSINELKDDENCNITDIKHNDDYSVFDVTLSTSEVGLYDAFSVIGFYMYGGIYAAFAGNTVDKIVVNFYDPDGNLITTSDSSELSN